MFRLLSAVGGGHIRIWTIHYGHAFVCRSTSPVVLATVAVSFFYQREVAHSLYHFPQCRPLRFSPLSSGMACCRNARLLLVCEALGSRSCNSSIHLEALLPGRTIDAQNTPKVESSCPLTN